jgi:succinoglycan biosynthesis transport protein ExoP
VVRVEPQRPTEDLVPHTVSELLEDRLLTVRQELFARPLLEKVIDEQKLYPDIVSKRGLDAAVEQMRKDLEVKVEGDNAFELTYMSTNPEVAAKVANRLPELFAKEATRIRREQATRATEVFKDEVVKLQGSLADWEKKIAQFKVDHMGLLPEQLESNMRSMERLGMALQSKSEELRVAEGRRSELARAGYAADSEAGRLRATEDETQKNLLEARSQWTEDHPEVTRLQREYSATKNKRLAAESQQWVERQEKARAIGIVTQIQGSIADLQKQADAFQKRLDETPRWAHALSIMQRDYEAVKTKYQSVLGREVEAELAQDLEAKGASTQFNVLSPAGVPSAPAKPDRLGGLAIVLLLALAMGVLSGVVLEMRDETIRDPAEIREKLPLPLPVLAVVPLINGRSQQRRVLMPAAHGAHNTVN